MKHVILTMTFNTDSAKLMLDINKAIAGLVDKHAKEVSGYHVKTQNAGDKVRTIKPQKVHPKGGMADARSIR